MLPRLLGALLLTLFGALSGHAALNRRREQARLLRGLAEDLGHMAEELELLCRPLPELLASVGDRPFFGLVHAGWDTAPLPELWRRAADTLDLSPEEKQILNAPALLLGRYDAARQAAELRLARSRLEERAESRERDISARARLFPGLGGACGALLAVIML